MRVKKIGDNMHDKVSMIYCVGRYFKSGGHKLCDTDFSHIGNWGDKELVQHEQEEQKMNNEDNWHIGFEADMRFQNLQEKVEYIRDDSNEEKITTKKSIS